MNQKMMVKKEPGNPRVHQDHEEKKDPEKKPFSMVFHQANARDLENKSAKIICNYLMHYPMLMSHSGAFLSFMY